MYVTVMKPLQSFNNSIDKCDTYKIRMIIEQYIVYEAKLFDLDVQSHDRWT